MGGGGVCLSACWDTQTPWADTSPAADTPLPESRHTPRTVHAGRYGQQAGGTHPTGMHSCLHKLFWNLYNRFHETVSEPGAVRSFSAEPRSPTSLEVRWRPPAETSSAQVTGYSVQYRELVISDCIVEHSTWNQKQFGANTYRCVYVVIYKTNGLIALPDSDPTRIWIPFLSLTVGIGI